MCKTAPLGVQISRFVTPAEAGVRARRLGKVSWLSAFAGMTEGRQFDYWLVGIVDSKYDKSIVENKLTLLCKQRKIISWTIGASQPRFYPAA